MKKKTVGYVIMLRRHNDLVCVMNPQWGLLRNHKTAMVFKSRESANRAIQTDTPIKGNSQKDYRIYRLVEEQP